MGIQTVRPIMGTAAELAAANYTLYNNQTAIETDTGNVKVGDGSTPYTSLAYNPPKLGSSPVSTVSVQEYGDARDRVTVLTLTDFIVGALAGAAASLGLGNIVYAFPAGNHIELAYYESLSLKAAGTAVNATTGLGSVIASGAVSVLSGTATFQDRLVGLIHPTAAAGGAVTESLKVPTAGALTGIGLNVTASVKNVFLNSAGVWNVNNSGNLTATGVIVIKWTKMS